MIARIDIAETTEVDEAACRWRSALRAAAGAPGFLGAVLYRVDRRMNRDGYDLVSIVRWASLADHHHDAAAPAQRPFGDLGPPGRNLYAAIDGGRGPAWANGGVPHSPDQLVITNPYRIALTAAAENAHMWHATRAMMETREGFIDADLFQTFDPAGDSFLFVSRARWTSEESFLRQYAGLDYKALVAPFQDIFRICFSHLEDEVLPAGPSGAGVGDRVLVPASQPR